MRDMRSCSQNIVCCPNCHHELPRKLLVLSGGGLVDKNSAPSNLVPALPSPSNLVPPLPSPSNAVPPLPSPSLSPKVNSQVSPNIPLSFSFPVPLQSLPPPKPSNQDAELQQLRDTVQALRQSGWFYEGISFEDSHDMLKDQEVGTFLVRNSSNPKFLYSLSVQTDRGPTSVRLHYSDGYFRLHAQTHLQGVMPAFTNVIDLIQHYVQQIRRYNKSSNSQVWVDNLGKLYSPIIIQTPLKKKDEPPSLKHLSRLAIHQAIQSSGKPRLPLLPPPYTQLELPNCLKSYLGQYPHLI